ncbi:hypothetical protein [uncultured Helicobacter sp.]|uniref:hypothetical protein n=1 Tax=uncultured Helicobacter sp. TaxID=175537 RepID=UPI0026074D3C|nr:hypothetical protein [uncultured Helicobacter sp.]
MIAWCEEGYKNVIKVYNLHTKEQIESFEFTQANLHFKIIGNIHENHELLESLEN